MVTSAMPRAFTREQFQLALRHVAWFLQRQRTFILCMVLGITLMSALVSYAVAPLYTAQASIVVERSRNPLLRDENERPVTAIEIANDLRDIIRSRPVMEAVVDQLRPHEKPRRQSKILASVFQALDDLGLLSIVPLRERYIRRWTRSIIVAPDGDYVGISLTDEDPALAQAVVNAIVDRQQQRYVDLLRGSHGSHLRRDLLLLAQSQTAALRKYLVDSGSMSANPAEFTAALSQLREVRQLIATADAQVFALRARLGPRHADTLLAQEASDTLRRGLDALLADIKTVEQSATTSAEAQILIRSYNEMLATAVKNLNQSQLLEVSDIRSVSVRIAEYAHLPIAPDVSRLVQIMTGLAASLIFALGAAFIRDRLGGRVLLVASVETALGSPVRGVLKDSRRMARGLREAHPR